MAILVGIVLALATGIFALVAGFDRDRAFYATLLIIVGSYYALFATIAGGGEPLLVESAIFVLFVAAAVAGFKLTMWIIVAGLAAHGLFDLARGPLLPGNGAPDWWPGFCMGFDVAAALWLAALLYLRQGRERRRTRHRRRHRRHRRHHRTDTGEGELAI